MDSKRSVYGYLLNKTVEEFQRVNRKEVGKFEKILISLAKERIEKLTEEHMMWVDLISEIDKKKSSNL